MGNLDGDEIYKDCKQKGYPLDVFTGSAGGGHAMIISTQIVTVWVLTLFMAYLAGSRPNKR